MILRHRLLAAAAVLMMAGAAQAQTSATQTTRTGASPQTAPGVSPMTPVSPQSPASPTAPQAQAAVPPTAPADAAGAAPPSGSAFAAITPSSSSDVVTVLTQSGQFSTFLKAADATGLTPVLKTPGLTVFAPTDSAFAALPAGTLDDLMKQENLPKLQKLLTYHLVNARIPAIRGHSATQVATASTQKVTLDGAGDRVKINDATALQPAVAVGGGATLYPIDKVLSPDYTPPPAAAATAVTDAPAAAAVTKKATTTRKKR